MAGEIWRIRKGTGRDGQGHEGPWEGAAAYRRRPKSGVSKAVRGAEGGTYIRLDAAGETGEGAAKRTEATADARGGQEPTCRDAR